MEKIKITHEQARAVDHLRDLHFKEIERFKRYSREDTGKLEPLYDLESSEINAAYFNGYEVEEVFKEGDWVHYDNGIKSTPRFVTRLISKVYAESVDLGDNRTMPIDDIRHATDEEIATEKQRRFWNGNNRDVWELKLGDALIDKHDPFSCDVKFVQYSDVFGVLLANGIRDEFAESNSELEDKYRVLCFKEDRKDIN